MEESPQRLVRTLTVFQGIALAASLVMGTGVLGLPGIVLDEIGPGYAALAWAVTATAMVPFIMVFARLASHFPSSPGLLSYAEFAFGSAGRKAASLMLLANITVGFPALVLIGGSFLQGLVHADAAWAPACGLIILAVAAGCNLLGLRTTARFNAASLIILGVFMVVLTILQRDRFVAGLELMPGAITTLSGASGNGLGRLWQGAALIFWAFLGWENLGFGVQEIRNPRFAIPRIFGGSFVLVTTLFLMLALTSSGAAVRGEQAIFGPAGILALVEHPILKPLCSLVLVCLVLGNANAWMYTVSRLLHAEATDGMLPRSLARLSRRHIPVRCLLFCVAWVATSLCLSWLAGVRIAQLILIVNQNCLFLFLASIRAYARVEQSPLRWLVVPAALGTCTFFLAGFSVWILFPLGLIALGYVLAGGSQRANKPTAVASKAL